MPSFEIIFEDDEDVLEATFAAFDENFARTIPLNDNIVLYTDLAMRSAWGITLYDYTRLLQVSETHLDGLRSLEEPTRQNLLALLGAPPISHFLQVLDRTELRALVKAPALSLLLG